MFDAICTLPLTSDLFAQAVHPKSPALAVGLSSGHVQYFKLPPVDSESGSEDADSTHGYGQIETSWRTKRHKISCRALAFSHDGEALYSAGADGLVKAARAESGQVSSKIAIPYPESESSRNSFEPDPATLLHVLTPQTIILATDSSALHVYDLRSSSHTFSASKPANTYFPHEDFVSSLTPLPPSETSTSGFSKQWVTTGGMTLSVTDLRKGVLTRSADQDEELLSSAFVDGFSKRGTNVGSKVVVGNSSGVLTLWERGVWDDMDERIVLDRGMADGGGESVECIARVPVDVAGNGKMLVTGMGGGLIAGVQLGENKVVDVWRHDEIEAVVAIGFDVGNRMISGGGRVIKVWEEKMAVESEVEEEEEEAEETNGASKRALSSDEEDDDSDDSDDSSDDGRPSSKKKRKNDASAKESKGYLLGSFKDLD